MTLPDWSVANLNAAAPWLNTAIAAYGLDATLIYGQCSLESHFIASAFATDKNGGSYGLMQVDYPTAQGLGYTGEPAGLFDPATSADLGCAFMAQLLTRFGGDWTSALAAYNAGPGNVALPVAQAYAANVLQRAAYFAALFAGQQPVDPDVVVTDDGTGDTSGSGMVTVLTVLAVALVGGLVLARLRRG